MKYIIKNYLKSYFKEALIAIATIFYLVFVFINIFTISASSVQEFDQYSQVMKNSNKWNISYDETFSKWNFSTFDDDDQTFKMFENLKDELGNKLLMSDWKNKIDEILNSNSKEINSINFNNELQSIESLFYLSHDNEIVDSKTSIKIGDVLDLKADWSIFNYSLINGILANIVDIDKFKSNFGFNNTLIFNNYYSKSIDANNASFSYDQKNYQSSNPMQTLEITSTDNAIKNNMSQVFLQTKDSHMPNNDDEILVNKQFADSNGWKIGTKINLFGAQNLFSNVNSYSSITNKTYKIVGFGMSLSSSSAWSWNSNQINFNKNSKPTFGNVYLYGNEFNNFKNKIIMGEKNSYDSSYNWKNNANWINSDEKIGQIADFNFTNTLNVMSNKNIDYNDLINTLINENYIKNYDLSDFVVSWNKIFINLNYNNAKTTIIVNVVLGLFSLSIAFIFLNFVIKKDISNSQKQIGIFKALGYKNYELSWIFSIKTLLTLLITSIIGFALSLPLQKFTNKYYLDNSFEVLTIKYYNFVPWFLCFIFIIIPLTFTLISFFINLFYLNKPIVKLLAGSRQVSNLWLLKPINKLTRAFKLGSKIQISFIVQSLFKWLLIVFIFMFATMFLIFENSALLGMANYMNNASDNNLYTKNVNSIVNTYQNVIDKTYSDSNAEYFQTNFSNLFFTPIDSNDEKINESINNWEKIIKNEDITQIEAMKINENSFITINELNEILNLPDISGIINSNFKTLINLIIQNNSKKGDTIVSFNNFIINKNKEYNVLSNWLKSNLFYNFNQIGYNNVEIDGITNDNNEFKNFFVSNGITSSQINEIINDVPIVNNDSTTIPVIISEYMAKFLNLKIGDVLDGSDSNNQYNQIFLRSEYNSTLKIPNINLNIVGIAKKNYYSARIFTGYNNLAKFYVDSNKNYFYNTSSTSTKETHLGLMNETISYDNLYPDAKKLQDILKSKNWNISYIPYYAINNDDNLYDGNATFFEFMENPTNLDTNNALLFSETHDIPTLVPQLKGTIDDLNDIFNIIQIISIILAFTMIGILLLICVSIIIDENKNIIITLKSLGYTKNEINWWTNGSYLIGIIFGMLNSIWIAYLLLKLLEKILFKKAKMLIVFNISISNLFLIILFAFIILWISWLISNKIIYKKNFSINE